MVVGFHNHGFIVRGLGSRVEDYALGVQYLVSAVSGLGIHNHGSGQGFSVEGQVFYDFCSVLSVHGLGFGV